MIEIKEVQSLLFDEVRDIVSGIVGNIEKSLTELRDYVIYDENIIDTENEVFSSIEILRKDINQEISLMMNQLLNYEGRRVHLKEEVGLLEVANCTISDLDKRGWESNEDYNASYNAAMEKFIKDSNDIVDSSFVIMHILIKIRKKICNMDQNISPDILLQFHWFQHDSKQAGELLECISSISTEWNKIIMLLLSYVDYQLNEISKYMNEYKHIIISN